jgi:hypothetical protein
MSVPRCRQSIFPIGYRMNIPYTITMGMGVAPIMQLCSEHYWRLLTRRPLSALRALPHRTAHFKNSSQPLWKSGGLHMTSFADSCMRTHAHMQSHGHMGLPGRDFCSIFRGFLPHDWCLDAPSEPNCNPSIVPGASECGQNPICREN